MYFEIDYVSSYLFYYHAPLNNTLSHSTCNTSITSNQKCGLLDVEKLVASNGEIGETVCTSLTIEGFSEIERERERDQTQIHLYEFVFITFMSKKHVTMRFKVYMHHIVIEMRAHNSI